MRPNVFWLTKDWKEQWEAADFQALLAQAQDATERPVIYDVPSHEFCDEDTVAIAPPGMRCDVATAELLHDNSAIPVPGTDLELDVDVHWDGQQFWLRLVVPAEVLPLLEEATDTETKQRLLQVRDTWISEQVYSDLADQADRDETQ
jgi:hypothetical protein